MSDNRCPECGEPLMDDGRCINRSFCEKEKTPPPAPNLIEVFRQTAIALDGLQHFERARVLKALCILFEVKP